MRTTLRGDQPSRASKSQIDDTAAGDSTKDFYGIRLEPPGKYKNRTGAIYKIQAGDRVWHLNFNEPAVQNYTPGPALVPNIWFEYEIVVQADDYTVFLTNLQNGQRRARQFFITQTASADVDRVHRGASVFGQHRRLAPHPRQDAVAARNRRTFLRI